MRCCMFMYSMCTVHVCVSTVCVIICIQVQYKHHKTSECPKYDTYSLPVALSLCGSINRGDQ